MENSTPPKGHRRIVAKYGEHFCAAPFSSLFEGANGRVTTCCKSWTPIGDSQKETFTDIMNSAHAKEVRRAMLAGEKHWQCQSCWRHEDATKQASYNRVAQNDNAEEVIDQLVENTLEDGTLTEQAPSWLDLTWTNKCNFACLGCSPNLSSTIANRYYDEFKIIRNYDDKHPKNQIPLEWSNGNSNKIAYILEHSDSIHRIHLNGGEPFMNEDIYELLEGMLKRGLNKKIVIWSHTNGSILNTYKGKNIIEDYLVHWGDRARISMSQDGHGARGEYIRYGYNESKWLKNYQRFREAGVNLSVQTCWSALNSLTLEEHATWFMDNCQPDRYGNIDGALTLWGDHPLSGDTLKHHEPTLKRAIAEMQKLEQTRHFPTRWWKGLETHLASLCDGNPPGKFSDPRAFVRGIDAMDKARNTDFDTTFPELVEFRQHLTKIVT